MFVRWGSVKELSAVLYQLRARLLMRISGWTVEYIHGVRPRGGCRGRALLWSGGEVRDGGGVHRS